MEKPGKSSEDKPLLFLALGYGPLYFWEEVHQCWTGSGPDSKAPQHRGVKGLDHREGWAWMMKWT